MPPQPYQEEGDQMYPGHNPNFPPYVPPQGPQYGGGPYVPPQGPQYGGGPYVPPQGPQYGGGPYVPPQGPQYGGEPYVPPQGPQYGGGPYVPPQGPQYGGGPYVPPQGPQYGEYGSVPTNPVLEEIKRETDCPAMIDMDVFKDPSAAFVCKNEPQHYMGVRNGKIAHYGVFNKSSFAHSDNSEYWDEKHYDNSISGKTKFLNYVFWCTPEVKISNIKPGSYQLYLRQLMSEEVPENSMDLVVKVDDNEYYRESYPNRNFPYANTDKQKLKEYLVMRIEPHFFNHNLPTHTVAVCFNHNGNDDQKSNWALDSFMLN